MNRFIQATAGLLCLLPTALFAQIVINPEYAEYEPIVAGSAAEADAFQWLLPEGVQTQKLGDEDPLKSPVLPLWAKPGEHTLSLLWAVVTPDGSAPKGYTVDFSIDQKKFKVVRPGPPNVPPTANAGADVAVVQPQSTAVLNGSGSDEDGQVVGYAWSQSGGPVSVLATPNAAQCVVNDLAALGVYTYTLTVTDNAGATGSDTVVVTVTAEPPPQPIPPDQFDNLGQRCAAWASELVPVGYRNLAVGIGKAHASVAQRLENGQLLTMSQAAATLRLDIRKDVLDTQEKRDAWAVWQTRVSDVWDQHWPTMDKDKMVAFYSAIAAGLVTVREGD